MKKILIIVITLLININCFAQWANLANNQEVSIANLENAISTGVFNQIGQIYETPTNREIRKYSALYVVPIDANTNFSVHVYGNQNISGKYWGANSKPPVDTGQGYSSIFSKAIDSAFWFNFVNIGNTFPFVPNMFISGLNPNYFYKIQYISATQGNTNDYRFYSGVIFQNGNNIADTTQTGYVNGIGNTIQTIVSPLVQCNSSGVLNMQLGYYANAYVGYGIISGMIITEYMKE